MTSITEDKVAVIHYTLTDGDGNELDTSRTGDPMAYLHGAGNIVPGLEKALEGKAVGDRVQAVVPPELAYGKPSGTPPQSVPLSAFGGDRPEPGMPVTAESEDGSRLQLWIVDVNDTHVMITTDHPLAGVTLHFDVEVMEVRDATAEEIEHGHVHSGGGHHH